MKQKLIVLAIISCFLLSACDSNLDNECLDRIIVLENKVATLEEKINEISLSDSELNATESVSSLKTPSTPEPTAEPKHEFTYETILEIINNLHFTSSIDDFFAGGWISSNPQDQLFLYLEYECNLTDELKQSLINDCQSNKFIDTEINFEENGAFIGFNGNGISVDFNNGDIGAIGYELIEYDSITKIKELNEIYFVHNDYLLTEDMVDSFILNEIAYGYELSSNGLTATTFEVTNNSFEIANRIFDYYSDNLYCEDDYAIQDGEEFIRIDGTTKDDRIIEITIGKNEENMWDIKIKISH